MSESNAIQLEYHRRVEKIKGDLRLFGYDEKYLENKGLVELTFLFTDTREKLLKEGKTIADMKKQKELSLQKQLEEQKREINRKEIEHEERLKQLQDKADLTNSLYMVKFAEVDAQPKTLPSQEEEKQLKDDTDVFIGKDEWGKGVVTRKIKGRYV